jgi:quercetin dioxygenase-like cupin family protein
VKPLPAPPDPHPDRPASAILHDEPALRVVAFTLLAGQRVPPHYTASSLVALVTQGSGSFQGDASAATLRPGEAAAFAPGELHAIEAGDEGLRFLALIAPRPA